jgi:ferritin-like protein
MSKNMSQGEKELDFLASLARTTNRRTFLQWSGVTIGVVALGCGDDNSDVGPGPGGGSGVDLGTGDTGVLNYAYALEQLEAAFYTEVLSKTYFSSAPAGEQAILTDIRNHEVIHRDFLKAALGAAAIPTLTVDFTSVNFADRDSVLGAAKTFEDLGVSAYNGAGKLLTDPANLLTAGKIVSVEARHASAVRDLLDPNSFANADVVDPRGLDLARSPSDVLKAADPFVVTTITSAGLPTT